MTRARGNQMCIVCGHNLGPYGRICDKCGSIQRPSKGDGLPLPPDKLKPCVRCGQMIPVESQEDICAECAESDAPRPVVWIDDTDPRHRSIVVVKSATGVSSAAAIAAVLSVIFIGAQAALIIFLAVSAVALGASVASWVIISKRPAHKIEYFAPVKQEQQGSNPSS